MKKFISLAAAALILAAFTACGHDGGSSQDDSPSLPKPAATTAETEAATTAAARTEPAETTTAAETTEAAESSTEAADYDFQALAMRYYGSRSNHIPEFIDVEQQDDGTVSIHLYDLFDGHTATCDWYYIDPNTAKGTDILGRDIDLNFKEAEMWSPEVEQRSKLSDNGSFCGISYICYMPGGMEYSQTNVALREMFLQSGALDEFGFISEVPEKNYASTSMGTELYLIIPRDPEAHVVVTQYDMDSDRELGRIYSSYNGSPFLLRCNYSDISSDVRITVTDNEGVHQTFSPYISLMDGKPAADCASVTVFELVPPEPFRQDQ